MGLFPSIFACLLVFLISSSTTWAREINFVSTTEDSHTSQSQIYRFIDGLDSNPKLMSNIEVQEELNDRWARTILRQGEFPHNVSEIVTSINSANPNLSLASYLVGEGSQVPVTNEIPRNRNRNLRYIVTWPNPLESDAQELDTIFLSAPTSGASGFHQVIAWDSSKQSFNYYERISASEGNSNSRVWAWTGDSRLARNPQTMGKGCFDCHLNGSLIMKELRRPWNNWHSPRAPIENQVVPVAVSQESLFQNKQSAAELEKIVESANFRAALLKVNSAFNSDNQIIENVPELLRHLTSNTTVNLESTQSLSSEPNDPENPGKTKPLPTSFFANDIVLRDLLQISYNVGDLRFSANNYSTALERYEFKLVKRNRNAVDYQVPSSTHFAFFVPVPSDIDVKVIQRLLNEEIVTPHFVGSILMVDFPNPVFSAQRRQLQTYAEQMLAGQIESGVSNIPQLFAELVKKAATEQPDCDSNHLGSCTPEQQFLFFWNLPESDWQTEAGHRLQFYFDQVLKRIQTPDGLDDYLKLSVSRRHQFDREPLIQNLHEFSLLFPETNLNASVLLVMHPDGTVTE